MSTSLYAVVVAPPVPAPRGATLLRSANPVVEPDPRWMQGLTWRAQPCGSRDVVEGIDMCVAFSGFTTDFTEGAAPQYVPPHVAVALPCSGISGQTVLEETRDRAAALLDRCQTLGIADELWTGDRAIARGWPNDYLSESAGLDQPKGTTAQGVIRSFAEAEQYLADSFCAGGGMIHATPRTATYWARFGLVDRQADGRLLSKLGTVVVADPGYDGSAPDGTVDASGDTAWVYMSGSVDVRLGPVELSTGAGLDLSGIDRLDNDFTVYAHRAFAATFESCARGGINVSHTTLT